MQIDKLIQIDTIYFRLNIYKNLSLNIYFELNYICTGHRVVFEPIKLNKLH